MNSLILVSNTFNLIDDNLLSYQNDSKQIPYSLKISSDNPPNSYYFKFYKTITIDHNKVYGSGSHDNFPFLVSIFDEDLHDHVNQSNGNDIAFANDTDWLDHELELFNKAYNTTHAQLVAWVRIPSLSTIINTTLYMYYGNATMSSRQNPASVWSSSYHGVWHLAQSSGSVIDSTSYTTSGTVSGTVNRNAIGQINGAYDFGSNGMINFGDPSCLDVGTSSFSISFWIKFEGSTGGFQLPVYKGATTEFDIGYDFETMPDDSGGALSFRISDGAGHLGESDGLYFVHNNWIHVTGVVNRVNNTISIFKNGLQVGTPNNITGIGTLTNTHNFLAPYDIYTINGLLDEIRILNIPLPAGWINTEYSNQYDPLSFFTLDSESKIDFISPTYSNLNESSDPLELGNTEVIQINVTDASGISQVLIEFEGSNHSMINIVGDLWQYNSWIPNVVGNYTYIIYMQDNLINWNFTTGTIEVVDSAPPTYSNLWESADPLELGQTEVIEIIVNDIAGINQVLIGFEDSNHSMTNIGGNIWQYNSWLPDQWIIYEYEIHMQDNNGNWNSITNNISVQDTINPPAPILNNGPSGDVSGNLVFDWSDGNDPSGIAYYILIIDNEADPSITPGYVRFMNLTNAGSISSYYELTETFPSGRYYYFLAQVDGAGHQSEYTIGSFTINLNQDNNDPIFYVIIAIALISIVGSIIGVVIMRKKSQKRLRIPRKKIPFKIILSHITEISPSLLISEEKLVRDSIIKRVNTQITYKKNQIENIEEQAKIEEIKDLGVELFNEGAYLEALKQFEHAKEFSIKQGKEEEFSLLSELINGIRSLIKEREMRIEALGDEKTIGNSVKIFGLYQDIIEISKKLKDFDVVNMVKSEMIDFYNNNKIKLLEIQRYRNNLEVQAELSSNNGQYKKASNEFEMCEKISDLIMNFNKNEIINVEKFRKKKNECQNKSI